MGEARIKAKGWDVYRVGGSMFNPYKRGTWRALSWQDGYNAAEKEARARLHRRSWDRDGQYGALPSATLPAGSDVFCE